MSHHYSEQMYVQRDRVTWAVQQLILINVAVFAAQLLIDVPFGGRVSPGGYWGPPGGAVNTWLGFKPYWLFFGAIWQPFTYQFLHAGIMHLFFNMLWLFFFGPEVERVLGSRQFVRFYVFAGALGVLASVPPALMTGQNITVTGASGAVMAVMVAFAMTNPDREFFLFPLPMPINARALIMIVIVMNVIGALGESRTSVATHFGGMAVGYLYMKIVPRMRDWRMRRHWRAHSKKTRLDEVGDMVDNIFKFDDFDKRQ